MQSLGPEGLAVCVPEQVPGSSCGAPSTSLAPKPRPPRASEQRGRDGWAQGAAAVSPVSSGGKASLPSEDCGRESAGVEGSSVVSQRRPSSHAGAGALALALHSN